MPAVFVEPPSVRMEGGTAGSTDCRCFREATVVVALAAVVGWTRRDESGAKETETCMAMFVAIICRTFVQEREEHAIMVVEAADRAGAEQAAEAVLAADIDRLPWKERERDPLRLEYSTNVEVSLVTTAEEDEAVRRLIEERQSGAGDYEIPF